MQKEQPKQEFSLQVDSNLTSLGIVLQWFTQTTQAQIPDHCFLQCQTMLAEGFTNAVRHAHRNFPPQTLIEIKILFYTNYLEIQIWDSGQPFDLKGKLHSLLEQKPEPSVIDMSEGGRGLKFIHALTDEFQYVRDIKKAKNCLVMQKKIDSVTQN